MARCVSMRNEPKLATPWPLNLLEVETPCVPQVEAYALKLKASREEMIAKIEAQQAEERRKLVDELKRDVDGVLEGVLETLKDELNRENRDASEESDRRRQEHVRGVLFEHAEETKRFNEDQVHHLRDAMANQRDASSLLILET